MTCKERLETYLNEQRVPFEVQRHERAFTAQRVAESEHISGHMLAKVVIVYADGETIMVVVPASSRVDLGKMAEALDVQEIRLAEEREFLELFPDCEVGAMPPFGNLYGLPVYSDAELAGNDIIFFQAGTHTETMSMAYADYARLIQPKVLNLAREPYPA